MLLLRTTITTTTTSSLPLPLLAVSSQFSLSRRSSLSISKTSTTPFFLKSSVPPKIMSWLGRLGFGTRPPTDPSVDQSSSIAQGPDDDVPAPGQEFAQFGAGCFWGVELAFQRVPGVSKTEVGYTQGIMHNPTYNDICSGTTNHSEVVRVQYDPKACSYDNLLDVFWERHDPTTLNRQVTNQTRIFWDFGIEFEACLFQF